jgi:molecular chaperone HscC
MGSIIGIDLGTTNSAVAVWRDGAAHLIPNSLGQVLTPSAVGLGDKGDLLVGLAARERQSTHPQLTATTFKRYMGSRRETRLGETSYLPEELSALVLAALKADAEAFLGEPVNEAVITVPAYFNDRQRKATKRAGELAGIKVERLLNEPTAAALAYGIHDAAGEDERRFLVFDLGGGTFDVAILELFEGVIEVRASTGDNRLGGEDFNEILIETMTREFAGPWAGAKGRPELRERLRVAAERARRELTSSPQATMAVVWEDVLYEHLVAADEFEAMARPLIDRLREPVVRSLRDSNLRAEDLREIVLVGGATRMPVVRRAAARMFGRFPATGINPDEAVALGAAVQAGLKARDSALDEVVMTDVCPYSLGVEVAERGPGGAIRSGIFSPIIERNTVIPASRVETYSTVQDGQRVVELGVYQGESRLVVDNVNLGKVSVKVPAKKAGEIVIECRFTYDINGLLEVDVTVPMTGEKAQAVIVDEDNIVPAELEKRRAALAALKVHPRDDAANQAALTRADRCYQASLGDVRTQVGLWVSEFEAAVERQDPRHIEAARAELLGRLDRFEGETWL